MDQQEQRVAELMKREAAIAAREREMRAKDALAEADLPQALAGYLDVSSEEALSKSLRLALEAMRHTPKSAPGTPKADRARVPARGDYAQRALLYQADRHDYLEQYKGER